MCVPGGGEHQVLTRRRLHDLEDNPIIDVSLRIKLDASPAKAIRGGRFGRSLNCDPDSRDRSTMNVRNLDDKNALFGPSGSNQKYPNIEAQELAQRVFHSSVLSSLLARKKESHQSACAIESALFKRPIPVELPHSDGSHLIAGQKIPAIVTEGQGIYFVKMSLKLFQRFSIQ